MNRDLDDDHHENLLRAALAPEGDASFRTQSLQLMLAAVRRRRLRRRLALAGSVSAGVCALIALLLARPPFATPPAPHPAARVTSISDAQLLALFPDRPLALIGNGSTQTLVFLDAPHAPAKAAKHE